MRLQSSHALEDRGLDPYFTPLEATLSLMELERAHIPQVLWEPACGNGAIVKPLRQAGYKVAASDIHDYGFPCRILDYLKTEKPDLEIQGIITNPPFLKAVEFAQKALEEVDYLALLLRTNFLESTSRLGFFRQTPPNRIWLSSRRLPMMHRHGWTGPEAPSNTCYAWFIWTRGFKDFPILNWFDWAEHAQAKASDIFTESSL